MPKHVFENSCPFFSIFTLVTTVKVAFFSSASEHVTVTLNISVDEVGGLLKKKIYKMKLIIWALS